jgi:hypothetical protein
LPWHALLTIQSLQTSRLVTKYVIELCISLPAPLPKPIDEYMSSIVLLRGMFPVDLKVTSSDLTVRGVTSIEEGVLGDEA